MEIDDKDILQLNKSLKVNKIQDKKLKKNIHIESTGEPTKHDINYLKGQIRLAFTRSDYKAAYLDSKKLSKPRYTKSGSRHKVDSVYWICGHCEENFKSSQIEVDHKIEVTNTDIYLGDINGIGEFVKRLYCGWHNLQVLCKSCHAKKTKKYLFSD